MRHALLLTTLAAQLAPATAAACGVWILHDREQRATVRFYSGGATIRGPGGAKQVLRIDGPSADAMYGRHGRWRATFRKNTIRQGREVLARIDEGKGWITVGSATYTIHLAASKPSHGQREWSVRVNRGRSLVARGTAVSLCQDGPPRPEPTAVNLARERKDIQRRVLLYLTFRHHRPHR